MQYQFNFDRKRIFLMAVALLLVGVLTFFSGVVTGIGMGKNIQLAQSSAKPGVAGAALNPNKQLAAAKTALKIPPAPTAKSLLGPAATPAAALKSPVALAAVTAPAAAAPTTAPPATAPASTTPAATAPAAATPAAPLALATAEPATPNPADQPFVLQLGAFREQKNAKQLQADLKQKGYNTVIYNMVDEDQRTWHMVRLGGFKDMSTAAHAASDFTGKEGIQAFIRRSDSL